MGQEEDQHNSEVNLSEFNTNGVHCRETWLMQMTPLVAFRKVAEIYPSGFHSQALDSKFEHTP